MTVHTQVQYALHSHSKTVRTRNIIYSDFICRKIKHALKKTEIFDDF